MIGAIIFILCIPYIIFSIIALLIMLSEKISRALIMAKRNKIRYNEDIELEKAIQKTLPKEKWISNLKNGKKVNILEATIQCKNQTLIINKKSFNIKEIQTLELKHGIKNVWKTTIDNYQHPSICVQIRDFRITLAQYHNDIELQKAISQECREGKTSSYLAHKYSYIYKFDKIYYISIILDNGNSDFFPIAFISKCDKEEFNLPREESLVLELNKYINSLK